MNSDDKDEHSESENEEPKYTVAQLVSAFNKHQDMASKTSLEAIMSEKRVNEVTFPTGPKALRLFIPDINITERGIVRRKTSYKPRKNWEELRKRSEKNEGILKDFDNDSGNEDDEDDDIDGSESHCEMDHIKIDQIKIDQMKNNNSDQTKNDQIKINQAKNENIKIEQTKNDHIKLDLTKNDHIKNDHINPRVQMRSDQTRVDPNKVQHMKIDSKHEQTNCKMNEQAKFKSCSQDFRQEWPSIDDSSFLSEPEVRNTLDTRIDEKYKQCVDGVKATKYEKTDKTAKTEKVDKIAKSDKIEKLLKTEKPIKIERAEKMEKSEKVERSDKLERVEKVEKSDKAEKLEKINRPEKVQKACPRLRPSLYQKERVANYIYPEIQAASYSRKDDDRYGKTSKFTDSSVNLKDILQKVENFQTTPKENLENLRKQTSIAKIILNDNLVVDNDTNNNGTNPPGNRIKIDPVNYQEENTSKLDVPPSFVRSSSLSSEGSCPTPSSVQSDIGMSWEDVHANRGSSTSLEKEESKIQKRSPHLWTDLQKSEIHRPNIEVRSRSSANLEDRKIWGKVCTGSYTRAMERFNGKSAEMNRKSGSLLSSSQQSEKIRRKSTPVMPQFVDS